jgi:hypothetical protein
MKGLLLALALAAPAFAAWPNGYLYRRTVTIQNGQVPTTLSSYPVLFSQTDAAWTSAVGKIAHTVATGGMTCPADFVFTSDAGGTTPIPFACEAYNSSTGAVIYWIGWPSAADGAAVYLFYGNPHVTTFLGAATSVWDTSFRGVWHLEDGTALAASDATSYSNSGTVIGAQANAGLINGAASFAAGTNLITVGSADSLNLTGPWTISAWIKPTDFGATSRGRVLDGSGYMFFVNDNQISRGLSISNDGGGTIVHSDANAISTGTWQFVTATWDGSTAQFYVNGARVGSRAYAVAPGASTANRGIGNRPSDSARGFNGLLDEVRISSGARSSAWIAADYASQRAQSSFLALGVEDASTASVTYGQAIIW